MISLKIAINDKVHHMQLNEHAVAQKLHMHSRSREPG